MTNYNYRSGVLFFMDYSNLFFGFMGGLGATIIMTIFEIPFWRKWGLEGILEWHENQILFTKYISKNPTKPDFIGIFFLHFVNGILGGIGFGLALIYLSFFNAISPLLLGILYGWFLWILTLIPIHKPITGLDPWFHPLGKGPAIVSFIGHTLYGITLGLIFFI